MAALALRKEERLGLGIAAAAHLALVAALLIRPPAGPVVVPPERITVTISDDVGLKDTAPDAVREAAPDVAPTLGEPAQQAEPEPAPPQPAPPQPAPVPPAPQPRPTPKPVAKPVEKAPQPKAEPRPKPPAQPKAQPQPKASAAPKETKPAASPRQAAKPAPAKPAEKTGGSRIGTDFLDGVKGGTSATKASGTPAAAIGPAVQASLSSAISRQLKPKWVAPQGPGAEDLVTVLAFSLNRDGSLAGKPRLVSQSGITDVNRNQADRHAEQAIRAVELAAPFDLPEEYYNAWKRVSAFRFDKRLSQ